MGFKKVICLVALSGFLRCTSDLIWNHGKLIPMVMLHFTTLKKLINRIFIIFIQIFFVLKQERKSKQIKNQNNVFAQTVSYQNKLQKFTWDWSKSLMASANPSIEKSFCKDGLSEFRCLILSASQPVRVLLVKRRVQGPPSVVKSQYVLTSWCPGGLIVKIPSEEKDSELRQN